jgi:hypothetical protein
MRSLFLIISSVLIFFAANTENVRAQDYYGTTDVKYFRTERDKEMRNKQETALRNKDLANFKGLKYFNINKNFRFEAMLTKTSDEKFFNNPTSNGKTKKLIKYGTLTFQFGDKTYSLNAYQGEWAYDEKNPQDRDFLFIPFKDLTNGKESYAGGRYIDIKIPPKGDKVILDFNLAYNPSCAYGSERFSCPIPPKENRLPIAVKAGEKVYLEKK